MNLDEQGFPASPPPREPLSASPHVEAAPALVTAEECAYLLSLASPALQPSVVVDPATGRMVQHPIRRSDAAMFGVHAEDVAVNALNRRIAAVSGTTPAQGEPLQVLRYRVGGEYRAHSDALPGEANQRVMTVLVYLTDGYGGGETMFLRTGLKYRGEVGDALLFRNVTATGAPDPLALHAGLPVTRGEKMIASRWIRARPFVFPSPQPLLGERFA
jgi:prolyl 4-hydroxylase